MDFYQAIMSQQLIGAHRGHRAYLPENTLAAFQDCPGNCDYIELDIQFTRDGVAVVFHDETLKRTSNALSHPDFWQVKSLILANFDYSQLHKLDVGSWFYTTDPFQTIQQGLKPKLNVEAHAQTILTFEQLLEFISTTDLGINVEIKYLHPSTHSSIKSLLKSLSHFNLKRACIISSFDHTILQSIKCIDKSFKTAALVEEKHPDDLYQYLKHIKVDGYHIDDSLVDKPLFDELKKRNYFCSIYTVNSNKRKKEIYSLLKTGSIITDYLY